MFVRFEENPNCGFVEDRVWVERTEPRAVSHVLRLRHGLESWFSVTAVEKDWTFAPALARRVEDSGEGMCYLIYGGLWGIRLASSDPCAAHGLACRQIHWSGTDAQQWGEGFLLLPADGSDVKFA